MSQFKAALIGKELSHSFSPVLHRELFGILGKKFFSGINSFDYDIVECGEESDVRKWIMKASTGGYTGANITYPYKGSAFASSGRRIGISSYLDSANTLRFTKNEIECMSTDGNGLLNSLLREYPSFDMNRYHLVLVGAGNAARAAAYSLCTKWMPRSLTIVNRSIAKAEELAEFCIAQAPGPTVRIMSIGDLIHSAPEPRHRLVIQCTPVGQINYPGNLLAGFPWHETDFAIDLIYNPAQTVFLQEASHAGAKIMNGLGMLIEQAALSQMFWLTDLLPNASPLSQIEYESLKDILSHSQTS